MRIASLLELNIVLNLIYYYNVLGSILEIIMIRDQFQDFII